LINLRRPAQAGALNNQRRLLTMSDKITGIPILDAKNPLGRISTPTLYGLINCGDLKTYKIGRKRYTTDAYIQECLRTLTARTMGGGRKGCKEGAKHNGLKKAGAAA
jgi:hypothetical protein